MIPASRSGTWGLLAFEALLAAYLLSSGLSQYVVMATLAAALLGLALALGPERVPSWVFAGLVAVTLWRAMAQTVGAPSLEAASYVTYAVPLGFALATIAAWRGAGRLLGAGLGVVGLARAWFAVSYLLGGIWPIAVANVLGAAGALLWAWSEMRRDDDALKPEGSLAPP